MEVKVRLKLVQNENQFVKGEELDQVIEDSIGDIELDGWEVSSVTVERSKIVTKTDSIKRLVQEIEKVYGLDKTLPWRDNNEFTNEQMIQYWCEEIKKNVLGSGISYAKESISGWEDANGMKNAFLHYPCKALQGNEIRMKKLLASWPLRGYALPAMNPRLSLQLSSISPSDSWPIESHNHFRLAEWRNLTKTI